MRPLVIRALLFALPCFVQAGQINGPVSGDFMPGTQSGSVGSSLAAPTPIQLSVLPLMSGIVPSLAAPLAPAPAVAQPVAVQGAIPQPLAVTPQALPALPRSALTTAKPRALEGGLKAAPAGSNDVPEGGADPGRALFDQGAVRPQSPGAVDGFYNGPPVSVTERTSADKTSPLRQMQISLESRGKGEIYKEAEAIFYTDGLTGLPNRAFLMAKAESLLKGVKNPTVAMLDMNNFGAVNAGLADVHGPVVGREMGDAMLASAGPKIAAIAGKAGVHVARLGGEEIVVFGAQDDVIDFAAAMRKAFPPNKILSDAKLAPGGREWAAIDAAMARMQRTGPMGDFTYGLARTEGRSFESALKAADGVLNKAKEEGLRGEAVMEVPGGLTFSRLQDSGSLAERVAQLAELPPLAQRPERLKAVQALKARLSAQEYAVFIEAAYRDPLTLTKTAEWIDMAAPEWEAAYEGRGRAAMLSARNFKAVNDVLGHAAGDRYLKKLGVMMRVEVNRLRKLGYSVEEPVRVGGKEFLLVGRDAAEVAELVGKKFLDRLNAGDVLPLDQLTRLRAEAPLRGLIPRERVQYLGALRAVDEPFSGGFKKTYERVILELESVKGREDQTP